MKIVSADMARAVYGCSTCSQCGNGFVCPWDDGVEFCIRKLRYVDPETPLWKSQCDDFEERG